MGTPIIQQFSLPKHVAAGALKPAIDRVYPLDQAAADDSEIHMRKRLEP